jgi:hypothetical protein
VSKRKLTSLSTFFNTVSTGSCHDCGRSAILGSADDVIQSCKRAFEHFHDV